MASDKSTYVKDKISTTFAGCFCSESAQRQARNLGVSEEVDAASQSADYKVTRDASHYVNCECHVNSHVLFVLLTYKR